MFVKKQLTDSPQKTQKVIKIIEKTQFILGETNFIQASQKKSLTGWFQGLILTAPKTTNP